jgi:hypothetical protein
MRLKGIHSSCGNNLPLGPIGCIASLVNQTSSCNSRITKFISQSLRIVNYQPPSYKWVKQIVLK